MDQSREQIASGVMHFGVAYLATAYGLDWTYCAALECWAVVVLPARLCPHHLEAAKNASEDGRRKRVQTPGSWGAGQRPE